MGRNFFPIFAKCTRDVNSVTIGNQSWSITNLDVATFRNGDAIKEAKTNEEWMLAELNGEPA